MKSMNSIVLTILISAGAVCLAMAINEVPAIWSLIMSWLRPPYLHIIINGIIITIAVASRFCRNQPAPPVRPLHLISVKTPPPAYYAAYSSPPEVRAVVEAAVYEREDRVVDLKPVMVNGREVAAEDEGEIVFADMTLTYDTPSPERFTSEYQLECFPTANPTGNVAERRVVPVTETVETTWETISEGPSRAAHEEFRHGGAPVPWPAPDRFRYNTRKSKSFKERTTYSDSPPSHASFGIGKKALLSRNKSNRRRVEAENVSMDRLLTYNSRSPEIFSPENDQIENIPQRDRRLPPTAEEYETLESAWKKITEGASRAALAQEEARYVGPPRPSLDGLKSISFKEQPAIHNDSPPSRASSGIRKEVSPSQDELNRRVEAFIKKVNDEIRLRRQNSSNQYIQLNSAA